MNATKKITFVAIILLVIGSIWYLESIKAHPTSSTGGNQAINIDATPSKGSTTTTTSTDSVSVSTQTLDSSVQTALQRLAAQDKAAGYKPAIEIANPAGFINTSSTFTLANLVGKKVVLLDFWTYSCINCVRTIPYLNAWYQKYAADGLEIVGIHTPEFDFEKNIANVQSAVAQYGIHYPVILDSNYGTWNAYNNLYWPHEYLIDMAGYIVHDQVGEGSYDETEARIQTLLAERTQILGTSDMAIPTSTVAITPQNINDIQSPETYFGAARNSLFANGEYFTNGTQTLTAPTSSAVQLNRFYLGGTWNFEDQYATNVATATITYKYNASNVYIVAAGTPAGTVVDVMQDGQPVSDANAGSDVHNGKVVISGNKLYNLIKNADGGGEHTLQLIIETPGLQAFTFTFG